MSISDGYFLTHSTFEVEITKLKPFRDYPIENLRGKMLKIAMDELLDQKGYSPIIVRPSDFSKESAIVQKITGKMTMVSTYEIIDGHYKVLAAKKLGWTEIRAYSKGYLTDEDVLADVPCYHPVGLLYKHNIDIYRGNYKETSGYDKIKDMMIEYSSEHDYQMPIDEYIEKFLLDPEDVIPLYDSKYDMGNPYQLSDDECSNLAVAHEIRLKSGENCDTESNLKNASPSFAERIKQDEIAECKEFVNRSFARKDGGGGYVKQLRNYLGFDLTAYDYSNINNKREQAKILYFAHIMHKHEDFKNIRVFQLLGNGSMENTDNAFWGWRTSNGFVTRFVKRSIEKELDEEIKVKVNKKASAIMNYWNQRMSDVKKLICALAYNETRLSQCSNLVDQLCDNIVDCPANHNSTISTPLEDLYFRIVALERYGHVKDTQLILEKAGEYEYDVPQEYWATMQNMSMIKLDKAFLCVLVGRENLGSSYTEENLIEHFFEPGAVQKYASLVYLKEETSKAERRKIRDCKEKVLRFCNFWELSDITNEAERQENFTMLMVISCLQCIILDKHEPIEYKFHGFEGKGTSNKPSKISVQAALQNDNPKLDFIKLFWVRIVLDRCYANMGGNAALLTLRKFELLCCKVEKKIFAAPTLAEMIRINEFYVNLLGVDALN